MREAFDAIDNKQMQGEKFYITLKDLDSRLPNITFKKLQKLLEDNVRISLEDKKNEKWDYFSVLNDIELTKEKILFFPSRFLDDVLNHEKSSNKVLKYVLLNGLKHKHAILLLDYIAMIDDKSFDISIDDLKNIFELSKDQYSNYHDLRRFAIDKAVTEINENSNFIINYKIKTRVGRKVTVLSFYIQKKYAY